MVKRNSTFDFTKFVEYVKYYEQHPGIPSYHAIDELARVDVSLRSCFVCGRIHTNGCSQE